MSLHLDTRSGTPETQHPTTAPKLGFQKLKHCCTQTPKIKTYTTKPFDPRALLKALKPQFRFEVHHKRFLALCVPQKHQAQNAFKYC